MVVASVILAIGPPAGTGRLAAIVFAAVASIWLGFALVVTSAGGERLDRWRLRRYERTVERLREQRALYEQTVDPAVERAKQERLTRLLIVCAVAPALVATASSPRCWPRCRRPSHQRGRGDRIDPRPCRLGGVGLRR
jgi:hypothetical protein